MRAKFKKMDKDGSGHIDLDEFLLSEEDSHMSDHMASMFHAMDQDGDGNVSAGEESFNFFWFVVLNTYFAHLPRAHIFAPPTHNQATGIGDSPNKQGSDVYTKY